MFRFAKSLLAGAALLGLSASHAAALEPANSSDLIQLYAPQNSVSDDDCPYLPYASGIFYEIGPNGNLEQPFIVPAGYVFVATSFQWRANGGPDDVSEAGGTVYAGVRVGLGGPAREVARLRRDGFFGDRRCEWRRRQLDHLSDRRCPQAVRRRTDLHQDCSKPTTHMIGWGYLNGYLAPDS